MNTIARLGIATLAAGTLAAGIGIMQPAEAHTAGQAITAGCGTGFTTVTGGHRAVLTSTGSKWGDVYLTYNDNTRESCVVTVKTKYHGLGSKTLARLDVAGDSRAPYESWRIQPHFAAIKAKTGGHCVAYWGDIESPEGGTHAAGGRTVFGNCT